MICFGLVSCELRWCDDKKGIIFSRLEDQQGRQCFGQVQRNRPENTTVTVQINHPIHTIKQILHT